MPHVGEAWRWLFSSGSIFRHGDPKSMVYVGHRHDTATRWHSQFAKAMLGIEEYLIVDIFKKNLDDARGTYANDPQFSFLECDIVELDKHVASERYDMIVWDGGPEHIELSDLDRTLEMLKKLCKTSLYLCCPWGSWPQDAMGGNVHERHRFDPFPEMFESHGMTVVTFNGPGVMDKGELGIYWFKP